MHRSVAAGALALVALLALVGCTTPVDDATSPSAPPASTAPTPTATDDAAPEEEPLAVFVPDGSAEDNAPVAARVVRERAVSQEPRLTAAEIGQILVEAGFAADTIEVTPDSTPLGNPTDSINFAVRVGEQCILGELRVAEVVTQTAPVLGTGRCLIGVDASIG